MSDSNIGGRKKRNVRNHLFILYGVINNVIQNKEECVDLTFYDIEKCFDALWTDDVMNDMYEVCEKDDKLALMYQSNRVSHVSINTPFGQTKRVSIEEIVMGCGDQFSAQ